jgi:alkylation response protein AidB-like acyl-CoA dehydrogenase
MEFPESIEDRRFRQEVRDWLETNRPRERRPAAGFAEQRAYDSAWQRAQYDGGWAGISWPAAYGGRGLSLTQQLIWFEEYARAKCPPTFNACWLGSNHAGPTLIARANEAQKAYHLPRILTGEHAWCQGFSEPNAGSDLASLRTRAEIDGDHLVVNGQKIWTTLAHLADYQELLLRTGPPGGRHRGLSWVICDMRSPGLTVRPITAMDGRAHNCEVFYDNVRIPLSNVVGEIDEGWSVAMTTLSLERSSAGFGAVCEGAVELEALIDYAREKADGAGRPLAEDRAIAEQLGMLRAEYQALRAHMRTIIAVIERDIEVGAEGGILHLTFSELHQKALRLALEILGPQGLSRAASESWVLNYFEAFSTTIAGGTSEIQRNIVGERVLGLPR